MAPTDEMAVTVTMTADEFMEFMSWRKDKNHYSAEMDAQHRKWEMLANKACWAIEADPKRPGKVKIVDHEHAVELLELANDYLS